VAEASWRVRGLAPSAGSPRASTRAKTSRRAVRSRAEPGSGGASGCDSTIRFMGDSLLFIFANQSEGECNWAVRRRHPARAPPDATAAFAPAPPSKITSAAMQALHFFRKVATRRQPSGFGLGHGDIV
jgi:hypothetical protein